MGRTTTGRGRPGTRYAADALCCVLLVLAVLGGAVGLRAELRGLGGYVAHADAIPRDHGRPVIHGFGGTRLGFVDFARARIPADEPVRIVQPLRHDPRRAGVCTPRVSVGAYFWLLYSLAPRPKTCSPSARWSVYFGISPRRLPTDAYTYVYGSDLVVVERRDPV